MTAIKTGTKIANKIAASSSNGAHLADGANSPHPRVAYFPDSFHEVNGVAHTSRNFEAFARRRNIH
jgi:hypothetical protein